MATVYSDVRTSTTQDDPTEFVQANQLAGNVRVARGVYEASALAQNDVIEMFALPNGARIVHGYVYLDALGASTDISVGHAAYVNSAGSTVTADADEFLGEPATLRLPVVLMWQLRWHLALTLRLISTWKKLTTTMLLL